MKQIKNMGKPIAKVTKISKNKDGILEIEAEKIIEDKNVEQKNKIVAGLLAIFLGGLGIHKFYLNKGVSGVLYILFCWTYIPSIIGFIEGIIYLLMDEKAFNKKYN